MGLYKNVAGQKIAVYAVDSTTGLAKTGDAANITAQISKDFGSATATNDTNPTELDATDHPGVYVFDLTQAETNADNILISAVSATSGIILDPIQVFTVPPNFRAMAIESDGMAHADVKEWDGNADHIARLASWFESMAVLTAAHTNDNDYLVYVSGDVAYLGMRQLLGTSGANDGLYVSVVEASYDEFSDTTILTLNNATADPQVNENDTFLLLPVSDSIGAMLGRGAVNSTSIANNAITADKIATNAITNAKLASGAISDSTLANDAITAAKIAGNAITSAKIASGALDDKGNWAKAGDEMDLVDAPNSTAVTAIQNGLATSAEIGDLATAAELAKVPKSDGNVTWNAMAATQITTQCTSALNSYDPPTRTEATADKDEILSLVGDIKAKTDNLPSSPAAVGSAMTLADDAITAAKFDELTAFPVKSADAGSTALARVGADGDTLETLSDQLDSVKAKTDNIIEKGETYRHTNVNTSETADVTVDDIP